MKDEGDQRREAEQTQPRRSTRDQRACAQPIWWPSWKPSRDIDALCAYLTERVASIEAIEHLETAPVIRTVKRAATWSPAGHQIRGRDGTDLHEQRSLSAHERRT
ncbi:hypothetical protein [Allokutzneria sp. NRRL B-24872]|uniref:hypothetical protein n=1 Tax=Allokutzneria sp. NRRL B-24872 TaxID=1137961 RepID=UPI001AF017F3|nr:hypothetical protein [Allokutzneria sp. NRRL B-24872]